MPGVQTDTGVGQPAADVRPDARVVPRERAVAGEAEVDLRAGPSERDVDRGGHRCRPATDHHYRVSGREPLMGAPQVRGDLVGGLQVRAAPEPVGDAGGDHEYVVRLGPERAAGQSDLDLAGVEVETGEGAVHGAGLLEPAVAVERGPVLADPLVRARQPQAELLTA